MSMFLKTLLASLALGVGGPPLAQKSDPPEPPKPPEHVAPAPPAETQLWVIAQEKSPALQKKVSITFDNAPMNKVFQWLASQGLNFAAAPDAEFADRQLSLSVHDVALSEVLDAIARAYGGVWVQVGQVHVLSNREHAGTPAAIAPLRIRELGTPQALDLRKALEGERMAMERARVVMPNQAELKEQIERALAEAQKEMEKAGVLQGKGLHELSPPQIADLRKAMEAERKAMDRARAAMPNQAELKGQIERALAEAGVLQGKDLQELSQLKLHLGELSKLRELEGMQGLPQLKLHLDELSKLAPMKVGQASISIGALKELQASLTPQQRALHAQRGYLRLSDLDAKQRALLGSAVPDGEWNLTFVFGDKRLQLRGG
ncbi:MAG: hypothetical protein M9921_00605 [Fimbriimonadaceae bacterium]|nr:hypothetical protein [Fimbriimonadaceae bacterium]